MDTKVSLSLVAYLYFLFTGISYLWGFWLPFELNILAYLDFPDLLKASIYPALPALGLLVAYAAIDSLGTISTTQHDEWVAAGGVRRWYMRFMIAFNWAVIAGSLAYCWYVIATEQGYARLKGVYPLISTMAFCYLIYGNKHLLNLDLRVRFFVVALVCGLPTYAFNQGTIASENLRNFRGAYWVISAKEPCAGVTGDLVYVARMGGKYFAMARGDKSLCIMQDATVHLTKKQ